MLLLYREKEEFVERGSSLRQGLVKGPVLIVKMPLLSSERARAKINLYSIKRAVLDENCERFNNSNYGPNMVCTCSWKAFTSAVPINIVPIKRSFTPSLLPHTLISSIFVSACRCVDISVYLFFILPLSYLGGSLPAGLPSIKAQ